MEELGSSAHVFPFDLQNIRLIPELINDIRSEIGEINIENPDIVYMTEVSAIIYIVDSNPIRIKSKFAKYNKNNYETNFNENVLLSYQNHKIRSKNLDLSFENNLATIYKEIVYNNDNTMTGLFIELVCHYIINICIFFWFDNWII